jgi:hypothetical protein
LSVIVPIFNLVPEFLLNPKRRLTVNCKKLVKIGIVAALTAAPAYVNASTASGQDGMNACATALVDELAVNQGASMEYNLDPESYYHRGRLTRREIIHLDARNPENNEVVARFDCIIDSRARVRELISVPLDRPDAKMRAAQLK